MVPESSWAIWGLAQIIYSVVSRNCHVSVLPVWPLPTCYNTVSGSAGKRFAYDRAVACSQCPSHKAQCRSASVSVSCYSDRMLYSFYCTITTVLEFLDKSQAVASRLRGYRCVLLRWGGGGRARTASGDTVYRTQLYLVLCFFCYVATS